MLDGPRSAYCSDTRSMVPPSGLASKWTEPAWSTREPTVRQAISSYGLSLMISASHSKRVRLQPLPKWTLVQ